MRTFIGTGYVESKYSKKGFARIQFRTSEINLCEANEIMNAAPKNLRLRRYRCGENTDNWVVYFDVDLTPTKGNEKNETGIKRLKRFIQMIKFKWKEDTRTVNYMSKEVFESILNS